MGLKMISATEIRTGTNILIDGEPYTVKKTDISKTGKHGSSKVRIEALGMISDQKKILVFPGHEKFDVPIVDKRKGQILSIGEQINIMDLESFETIDLNYPEELKSQLEISSNIEYWDIEGRKIIKRKI